MERLEYLACCSVGVANEIPVLWLALFVYASTEDVVDRSERLCVTALDRYAEILNNGAWFCSVRWTAWCQSWKDVDRLLQKTEQAKRCHTVIAAVHPALSKIHAFDLLLWCTVRRFTRRRANGVEHCLLNLSLDHRQESVQGTARR